MRRCAFVSLATLAAVTLLGEVEALPDYAATGAALAEPPELHDLSLVISLDRVTMVGAQATLTTRALNGSIPGGTVYVSPGDTLRVSFRNSLSPQSSANVEHNNFQTPDTSNLHWHGAYTSSEEPGDNSKVVVEPGDSYDYVVEFPSDHMPGTHWIHPHHHGSTALQVGGGAAMAFIIQDPAGYLPTQIETAKNVLWVIQHFDVSELEDIASSSGDGLFAASNVASNYFMTVNGMTRPQVTLAAYQWQRWRLVFAGWVEDAPLGFTLPSSCNMYLLAKDGVYIGDYPRELSSAQVPIGGRADVMVRCTAGGEVTAQGITIATIAVSGAAHADTGLDTWTPTWPGYLTDLQDTAATDGCACTIDLDGDDAVNGVSFTGEYMHTSFLGAVVERDLQGVGGHPYHQHVQPFQIISMGGGGGGGGDVDMSEYNHVGDWQDVYMGDNAVVRYKPEKFSGTLVMHCHRLQHEDRGMMAFENIDSDTSGTCTCYEESLEWWAILLIVLGSVCLVSCIAGGVIVWFRRRKKQASQPQPPTDGAIVVGAGQR